MEGLGKYFGKHAVGFSEAESPDSELSSVSRQDTTESTINPTGEQKDKPVFERREIVNIHGTSRVVIKGSVAFALKSGRDVGLARDIDIAYYSNDEYAEPTLQYFLTVDKAKGILPPAEYDLIKSFIVSHGLERLPIHIIRAPQERVEETALFENEPEVMLWDNQMEFNRQVVQPIPEEKKQALREDIARGIYHQSDWSSELDEKVDMAHRVHLYLEGKLIEGEMPEFLRPKNKTMAAALRLMDLGRRFDILSEERILWAANQQVVDKELILAVPPAPDPNRPEQAVAEFSQDDDDEYDDEEESDEEDIDKYLNPQRLRTSRSSPGTMDEAFYNVAVKKELLGLLTEKFPELAELVEKIKLAGGIREYITAEYGAGYLELESVPLDSYKFTDTEIPAADQEASISIWQSAGPSYQDLFHGKFKDFLETYLSTRQRQPSTNMTVREQILRTRLETALNSENVEQRASGYNILNHLAHESQRGGLPATAEYESTKQIMRDALTKETSRVLRKEIVKAFVSLSRTGLDMAIAHDLADIVRQEGLAVRTGKTGKRDILSPEGMAVLRGLFNLEHEDSELAVFELLANPAINPRLKKLCLYNLRHEKRTIIRDLRLVVDKDIKSPVGDVIWDDYESLYRIRKISSSSIRQGVTAVSGRAFLDIRGQGRGVAAANKELSPALTADFFLPLYSILRGQPEGLKSWDKFIASIKSNKMRESFLYSISNLLNYDEATVQLITEKIIEAPQMTKEHAAVADRLLKKLHSLILFKGNVRGSEAGLCADPNCNVCVAKRKAGQSRKDVNVIDLLREAKSPSLLEVKMDEMIVTSLYDITGRGDLSSDRIQSIFNAWENPEPILIFTSQLARRRGERSGKRSLDLMGEMLANMDPPLLENWKQWRYHNEDEFTKNQLAGMTPEQVDAYAEDEYADLGEVLVGLLPSDKPDRIREQLMHALGHDWVAQGVTSPLTSASRLSAAAVEDKPIDFVQVSKSDLEDIDISLSIIDSKLSLDEDLRVLEKLPEQLAKWQRSEIDKKAALVKMGLRGEETRGEIEAKIEAIRASDPNSKDISKLAVLKPAELPDKSQNILKRYSLTETVDSETVEQLRAKLVKDLEFIKSSTHLKEIAAELLPGIADPTPAQWQAAIKKLKVSQILLKLGNLTPQLIAFNRLEPGKKKSTLRPAIDYVRKYGDDKTAIEPVLDRIESIIAEESSPIGKDRLAVIFTDSPIASLTVGKFPNGATSCQNYENGDSALAAYMGDACTKMCLLIDLSKLSPEINEELDKAPDSQAKMKIFNSHTMAFLGASVGRRLTKIVKDEKDQKSKLFLEPIYTPLDRSSITRLMNAFAVTNLGPRINIPLVRGGGYGIVRVAESRNGYQYEDGEHGGPGGAGGGLGAQEGSYTMCAQPLQEKDYMALAV